MPVMSTMRNVRSRIIFLMMKLKELINNPKRKRKLRKELLKTLRKEKSKFLMMNFKRKSKKKIASYWIPPKQEIILVYTSVWCEYEPLKLRISESIQSTTNVKSWVWNASSVANISITLITYVILTTTIILTLGPNESQCSAIYASTTSASPSINKLSDAELLKTNGAKQ